MVVAFSGFLLGSSLEVKEVGFGMVAAVGVDATLIRLVLVPAARRVLGSVNWWMATLSRGAVASQVPPEEEPHRVTREWVLSPANVHPFLHPFLSVRGEPLSATGNHSLRVLACLRQKLDTSE